MKLAIVSRAGVVHRVFADGSTCSDARGKRQVEVSLNQCLVFRLQPCGGGCWPAWDSYHKAVRTGRLP